MLAHLPLRGMVRSRVLNLFANSRRVGGAPLDLDTPAAAAHGVASPQPLALRLAAWYVARQQRR